MSESHDGPASHKPGHGGHEEEHEEHVNHEAWVIPYADMLTLLMALFLMLWATSSVDQQKFAALADSLRDAFGNGTGEEAQALQTGSPGFMDGQQSGVENGDMDKMPSAPDLQEMVRAAMTPDQSVSSASQRALQREAEREEEEIRESATMNGIQKRITEKATEEGVLEALKFKRERRGLVVTVVSDNVLFDSGSGVLKPQGARILKVVGDALRGAPNEVMVEGHTDSTPIATSQFPSNWELSSYRGTSVLRFLVDSVGFPGERIASAGYGETRPLGDNGTAEGKSANRRVEIVVLSGLD